LQYQTPALAVDAATSIASEVHVKISVRICELLGCLVISALRHDAILEGIGGIVYEANHISTQQLTCFPVSGPIFAGKFQFSGCVIRTAGDVAPNFYPAAIGV
jgi:hypothetical protein